MRYRVLLNPVFSLATGEILSHDGESFVEEFPIKLDRSIQNRAKANSTTDVNNATGYQASASQIGSSIIPGLEREAQTPQGFTPVQKNNLLTSSQEAVGGANAGVVGTGNLTAARTRNAGGFARALDEAARQKGRQLSTNALNVENEDARLGLERQRQAQQMLSGLYGTDTSAALKSMGLSDEALNTALQAGKSGWLQNTEGVIDTLTGAAKAVKPGGFA